MLTVNHPPAYLLLRSNLLSPSRSQQIVSTPVNAHCGEAHCHCKEGYVLLSLTCHQLEVPRLTLVRTTGATALPRTTASAEAVYIPEAGIFLSCEIVYFASELKRDEKTNIFNACRFVNWCKEKR